MTGFLAQILADKQVEVAGLDTPALRAASLDTPAPRDFLAAMAGKHPPALIAELKRASPSKGMLAADLDLLQVARIYAENGASAVSVLTDEKYFSGALSTLRALCLDDSYPLTLLRKDFIISEAQVYETRLNGADALLLIIAALPDDGRLAALHALSLELGLTPLVEVHNEHELERAFRLPGLRLVGINNRDLATFRVSLDTTTRLRPLIPESVAVVSESGISSAADVQRVESAGVDAVLVGEALMTAPDIAAKVRELAGLRVEAHD